MVRLGRALLQKGVQRLLARSDMARLSASAI
jgi:hypothetical protein